MSTCCRQGAPNLGSNPGNDLEGLPQAVESIRHTTTTTAAERRAVGLLAGVRPGSIGVLHEGTPGRRGVARTTDELLAGLAGRGLSAVTVSAPAALRR
jgi:hypothetical protein